VREVEPGLSEALPRPLVRTIVGHLAGAPFAKQGARTSHPRRRARRWPKWYPSTRRTPSFDDLQVLFVTVSGTRGSEAALVVRRPGGTIPALNCRIGNIRNESSHGAPIDEEPRQALRELARSLK